MLPAGQIVVIEYDQRAATAGHLAGTTDHKFAHMISS
jgi:hypothetical protein